MKKIIFITLAMITLIIGTTGVLVTKLKNDLNQGNIGITIVDNKTENIPKEEIVKEKTLDLYGTYNQNDLLIIDKEIKHELFDEPIKLKQISGLKDKSIENKINKDIENKYLKLINDFHNQYDLKNPNTYMNENANFSNVISFMAYVSGQNSNGEYINQRIGFNYNLINGEEIEFKDLFTKDADIQTIVRSALYKQVEKSQDAYWDEELGKWMQTRWEYNYEIEDCEEITEEYIPYLTENEISKIVQQFVNGEESEFSFTPYDIQIYEPEYCNIKFEEFADMVTIYNKYLTKESLYERDDIGFENILTCSREPLNPETCMYKKTCYESENFFYDITVKKNIYAQPDIEENVLKPNLDKCINIANQKVEEYRELAKNNPDKMYILLLNPTMSLGKGNFIGSPNYSDYEYHNLMSIGYFEKVISGDMTEKENLLYKLMGTYRYQNLGMYMGIYYGVNNVEHSPYHFDSLEENVEFVVFDMLTGNEVTDIKEIFKPEVDYKSIIDNAFKNMYSFKYYYDGEKNIERTDAEIEEIFSRIEYKFDATEIFAFVDGTYEGYRSIQLSDNEIWPYLNLQKLRSEV